MKTLLRQQFVSQADLDLAATNFRDAQAQVEIAQAQVDQAVATLASAELDLGYTTIYSPVNGIVVSPMSMSAKPSPPASKRRPS
jgi:HlyD family secretion protein